MKFYSKLYDLKNFNALRDLFFYFYKIIISDMKDKNFSKDMLTVSGDFQTILKKKDMYIH